MIRGRAPARCVLGGCPAGAAAVVREGRLLAVEAARDGWSAALAALGEAGVLPEDVEQVAIAERPGRARRLARAREARLALGSEAGFRRQGLVGTGLPLAWDPRDRVTQHEPGRCRAAAAYYTAGLRAALVAVADGERLQVWLGTSGKLVRLTAPALEGLAGMAHDVGAQRVISDGVDVPGALSPPLGGAAALAVGAALVAWADERQGAWVPKAWSAA